MLGGCAKGAHDEQLRCCWGLSSSSPRDESVRRRTKGCSIHLPRIFAQGGSAAPPGDAKQAPKAQEQPATLFCHYHRVRDLDALRRDDPSSRYSTVTLLARLRGLSTSRPNSTAR